MLRSVSSDPCLGSVDLGCEMGLGLWLSWGAIAVSIVGVFGGRLRPSFWLGVSASLRLHYIVEVAGPVLDSWQGVGGAGGQGQGGGAGGRGAKGRGGRGEGRGAGEVGGGRGGEGALPAPLN